MRIFASRKLKQQRDCLSTAIDIANRLSFSSQSHFIQQFRELVGMTPKKYRDLNHLVQWDVEEEKTK